MSDQNGGTTEAPTLDELSLLKQRAKTMGLNYHPNIGLSALKIRVDDHLNNQANLDSPYSAGRPNKKKELTDLQRKNNRINEQRKAARKLIRVRITNHNPMRSEHHGEILTVSNSVVGTIKRFVPFGNDNGWHVEAMILEMIRERKYQQFYDAKDHRGRRIKKSRLTREFSIEEMKPLGHKELKVLKDEQLIANNLDD